MGGFFAVASKTDCVHDLFYGTDYHSHLGTMRGGLAVKNSSGFTRFIHDLTNAQFRSKFANDIHKLHGNYGIGSISDCDNQPLIISSHLGTYSIVTVGKITNISELTKEIFNNKNHFTEISEINDSYINQTELTATLINQGNSFEEGIKIVQDNILGSCSLLLLTEKGIYAARDKLGRTPIIIGKKSTGYGVTLETSAFPNLDFEIEKYIGPGEIVFITNDNIETRKNSNSTMQICSFLWVYYGYPASNYENINVEVVRNKCGQFLAEKDNIKIDIVAGIPDSGVAHAIGYANKAGIPYQRPFVKYTPTWPRSFMPQIQDTRDLVAKMKLIPIKELINGLKILFCEDSIVRATQLQDTIKRLYDYGAKEIHMRPACPPLIYNCKFLNFSRSKSELDLVARKAIAQIEKSELNNTTLQEYSNHCSDKHCLMVDKIRQKLNLTSLKYQKLEDLVKAIGLPKEKLCTYCWDGVEIKGQNNNGS